MPDTGQFTRKSGSVPEGMVTFLFTDVEGSSELWEADPVSTARSVQVHDELVCRIISDADGFIFGWAGDHFRAAFLDAQAAVGAALAIQNELDWADWLGGPALRVRMGLHRGQASSNGDDYVGTVLNQAGRLEAGASGGQILLSSEVAELVDFDLRSLGVFYLRDIPDPMLVYQVGDSSFPAVGFLGAQTSRIVVAETSRECQLELSEVADCLAAASLLANANLVAFRKIKLRIST